MTYVQKVLQPGENLRHLSRLHWVLYVPGFLILIVSLIALDVVPGTDHISLTLVAIVALAGLTSLVHAWFKRWTTEIAVTDRRVIYKRGFIRRRTIEMNMDKIESVDVDQSVLGRILNYGTITIRGTGTGIEPLDKIDSPIEFRNFVTAR